MKALQALLLWEHPVPLAALISFVVLEHASHMWSFPDKIHETFFFSPSLIKMMVRCCTYGGIYRVCHLHAFTPHSEMGPFRKCGGCKVFGSCLALSAHVWIPASHHRLPSHAEFSFRVLRICSVRNLLYSSAQRLTPWGIGLSLPGQVMAWLKQPERLPRRAKRISPPRPNAPNNPQTARSKGHECQTDSDSMRSLRLMHSSPSLQGETAQDLVSWWRAWILIIWLHGSSPDAESKRY